MMYKIIKALAPQLGGEHKDMQQYIKWLKISYGEPVLEDYFRVLGMSPEI